MNVFDRMKEVVVGDGIEPRKIRRHISNVCDVSYETVRLWASGDTKSIKSAHIVRFAEHYQLNQRWLTTGKGPKGRTEEVREDGPPVYQSSTSPGPELREVALISFLEAGRLVDSNRLTVTQGRQMIKTAALVGPKAFALCVEGASMGPKFTEGEIIIVDPGEHHRSGDYVIAKRSDGRKVVFRQLIQEGTEYYLKALNPHWPEPIITMGTEWEICGVVVSRQENFR